MCIPSSWLHRSCDSLAHSVFLRTRFCQPFSSPSPSPLGFPGFSPLMFFLSVTGACSFPFMWGLMVGLHCCANHGGIISIQGLAANSGSPWILQVSNLHFSDAVVNVDNLLTLNKIIYHFYQFHQLSHSLNLLIGANSISNLSSGQPFSHAQIGVI